MKRNSWVFMAYKSGNDYPHTPYFYKVFYSHNKLKTFSGIHHSQERYKYIDYCSTYFTFKKDGKS